SGVLTERWQNNDISAKFSDRPNDPLAGAEMDDTVHGALHFDRFQLDLGRGCLRAGDEDIDLRPKVFEVLPYLAENAGHLRFQASGSSTSISHLRDKSLQTYAFLPRSPPSAFSNSEGFVLSRRSCDQLTQCMQLTWCHRGESETTLGWHRP